MQKRIFFARARSWAAALCCVGVLLGGTPCSAELVTGRAAIIGGNVENAKAMARKDAMRTYAEQQVGVYVDSHTETAMGMVVSDRIVADAAGYVRVKRVVKEWQDGDVCSVTLDLEASPQSIETAVGDVRRSIEMLPESSTRRGVQVAVSGAGIGGAARDMQRINYYVQTKMQSTMEDTGFLVMVNDDVRRYMASHPDMTNLDTSVEVRRIARNTRGPEDALLRGTLSTVDVRRGSGCFIATVNASFELVGLADNRVSSFSDYLTAVGATQAEAESKAMDMAAGEAVNSLGQKVLRMLQAGFRQGVQATIVFAGIRDRAGDETRILQGLEAAGCQVLNSSFTSAGTYKVFVKSNSAASLHDMRRAIIAAIPGLATANDREDELGAQKIYLTF